MNAAKKKPEGSSKNPNKKIEEFLKHPTKEMLKKIQQNYRLEILQEILTETGQKDKHKVFASFSFEDWLLVYLSKENKDFEFIAIQQMKAMESENQNFDEWIQLEKHYEEMGNFLRSLALEKTIKSAETFGEIEIILSIISNLADCPEKEKTATIEKGRLLAKDPCDWLTIVEYSEDQQDWKKAESLKLSDYNYQMNF
ncbi:MAG TPA: hypothetical protein PKD96_01975 [Candidatus Absconditabacterales bacterium]|nr:hypothetical protein [Candidatus Absconditabacterales bacterium]HMT27047.1 hypothetical protein [Candidatus Absconditabacterales bacterium]